MFSFSAGGSDVVAMFSSGGVAVDISMLGVCLAEWNKSGGG